MLSRRWKFVLRRFWVRSGRSIVIAVSVLFALRSAVADWNDVPSGSMKPTILEGDRIFVNKLAYDLKVPFTTWHLLKWGGPRRGDVVVLFSPRDGIRLVKRVVGLPGDQIELRDNHLVVNGEAVSYESWPGAVDDFVAPFDQYVMQEQLGDCAHAIMVTPGRRSRRAAAPDAASSAEAFSSPGTQRNP